MTEKLPLILFYDNNFWLSDSLVFLKAPLTPIHTNFKESKNGLFGLFFFENMLDAQKNLAKRFLIVFWEAKNKN